MKKLTTMIILLSFITVHYGLEKNKAYGDAGIARYQRAYPHGHNKSEDGGSINLPYFYAQRSAGNITLSSGVTTTVIFEFEVDSNGWYNNTTGKFQPSTPGTYLILSTIRGRCSTTFTRWAAQVVVNTTIAQSSNISATLTATDFAGTPIETLVYMNGTTDFAVIKILVTGTGTCSYEGDAANHFYAIRLAN